MKWCSLGHEINFSFFFRIFRQSTRRKGKERRLSQSFFFFFIFDNVILKVEEEILLQQIMKLNSIYQKNRKKNFPFYSTWLFFHTCQLSRRTLTLYCEYDSHFMSYCSTFNLTLDCERNGTAQALWVLIFCKTVFFSCSFRFPSSEQAPFFFSPFWKEYHVVIF